MSKWVNMRIMEKWPSILTAQVDERIYKLKIQQKGWKDKVGNILHFSYSQYKDRTNQVDCQTLK